MHTHTHVHRKKGNAETHRYIYNNTAPYFSCLFHPVYITKTAKKEEKERKQSREKRCYPTLPTSTPNIASKQALPASQPADSEVHPSISLDLEPNIHTYKPDTIYNTY